MNNHSNLLVFRIFSANDWNQPAPLLPNSLFDFYQSVLSTIFSNAEKLRKTILFHPCKCSQESLRINRSIGLRMPSPFYADSKEQYLTVLSFVRCYPSIAAAFYYWLFRKLAVKKVWKVREIIEFAASKRLHEKLV